ncbi:MAG: Uma2 family endonuclease [Bacteroidota bacterium]
MSTSDAQYLPDDASVEGMRYFPLTSFLEEYADREDGFKYEWNDGQIEKIPSINQEQSVIFFLLNRLFTQTAAYAAGGGITTEIDMQTTEKQLRRPDIAAFTGEQIASMKVGENQIAPWLAEVISKNDKINRNLHKVDEYFKAGVQVVWHIFPDSKQVYVYTAPDEVKICRNEKICSAAPAFPDLSIAAGDLFV